MTAALKAFKNEVGDTDLVGAKAAHLILWSERGGFSSAYTAVMAKWIDAMDAVVVE